MAGYELVTCGSTIKLAMSRLPEYRLHSHEVAYGSGSGQQVSIFLHANVHAFFLGCCAAALLRHTAFGARRPLIHCVALPCFPRASDTLQSVTVKKSVDDTNSFWNVRGDIKNGCKSG